MLIKQHQHAYHRFRETIVHSPTLFLCSKNDPIGSEKINLNFLGKYKEKGISCTWKCWDVSDHVGHLRLHRHEYLSAIHSHLKLVKLYGKTDNNRSVDKL